MYESLRDKVALVTGAAAGIGRAIAERLADAGCRLAVNDIRPEALEETVGALRARGATAASFRGDMTDGREVERVVTGTVAEFGRLDILVNNVGLFAYGDLATLDPDEWARCLDINLNSVFLCSRAAIPHLLASHGSIVNIASGAGKVGGTMAGAYPTSKWAVIGYTKSLAMELAPTVRVNAVCPGIIATDMDDAFVRTAAAKQGVAPDAFVAERLGRIPMRRPGTPEDVARAVAFLASDEASYTTGEALNVSGGLVIH